MNKTIALFETLQERINPPLDKNTIYTTGAFIDALGLTDDQVITLKAGSRVKVFKVERRTLEQDDNDRVFRLLLENANNLNLKSGCRYWLTFDQESETLSVLRKVNGK